MARHGVMGCVGPRPGTPPSDSGSHFAGALVTGVFDLTARGNVAAPGRPRVAARSMTSPSAGLYWSNTRLLSLTWGYGAGMIGSHVCCADLPAARNRAVLAGAAGPVLVGQGRGATRAAARGGGAAPGEPQTASVLGRPGRARRARAVYAQWAAGPADRDSRHAAALAPPAGGGEVASAPFAGPPAATRRACSADRAPGPGEHPVGRGQDPGRAAPARAPGGGLHHPEDPARPPHPAAIEKRRILAGLSAGPCRHAPGSRLLPRRLRSR